MRKRLIHSALAVAAVQATAASAADWSGELSVVSDYRYRGVSLSNHKPSLQAAIDAEFKSGAYGELWLSTIADEGSGRIEADATAGYAFELRDGASLDLSATYYLYPKDLGSNALEVSAVLEKPLGPLTAKFGASLAPPQSGTLDDQERKRTNFYVFAGANLALGKSPFSLRVEAGRERGPWAAKDHGSKWDYAVGIDVDLKRASASLGVIGSNAGPDGLVGGFTARF